VSIVQPENFIAMEGQYQPLRDDGIHYWYFNPWQGAAGDIQVTFRMDPGEVPEYLYAYAPTPLYRVPAEPVVPSVSMDLPEEPAHAAPVPESSFLLPVLLACAVLLIATAKEKRRAAAFIVVLACLWLGFCLS
jgi:hypothetical protein